MPNTIKRHILADSDRKPLAGAHAVGAARADERLEVTLRLASRSGTARSGVASPEDAKHPGQRKYLSREEHEAAHGGDPVHIAKVVEFAKAHGLAVVESSAARRSVVLAGDVQAMNTAFGVTMQQFEHEGGSSYGEATQAPPDERGGYRQTEPTATAPHSYSTGNGYSRLTGRSCELLPPFE